MPTNAHYEPGQFCWVDLMARDVDQAKRFYGSLFGWTTAAMEFPGGPPYVHFQHGGKAVAGLGQMPPEMAAAGVPPVWNSCVQVEDVHATVARAQELGGTVTMPAMQILEEGHLAGLQDPTGGFLFVWQPIQHRGAELTNEPGSFCWNELATRDVERAREFYEALFGWTCEDFPSPSRYYVVKVGERLNGGLMQMTEEWGEMPPCWSVYFAVDDADATIARVEELGGKSCVPPFDIPVGRMAVAADDQGAVFCVIKLSPSA